VNPTPHRKTRLDGLAMGLLLACTAFWGLQQILVKSIVLDVPPLWQASVRFMGATVLLALWCWLRGIELFKRDGTAVAGLVAGLLFAGEFAFIYQGLEHTSASRLTVFLYTAPFTVAVLLGWRQPSERLRGWQWAGLVLAFAAVALAFSEGFATSSATQLKGDAMALAAGLLWALTTYTIRTTVLAHASAEKALFYQVGMAALVLPFLSIGKGEVWSLDWSAFVWFNMALQTVVGAFASYLAWMWMLRHYPATHMSSFAFLTPVFALLFGVGLLGEALTLQLVVALVGVGVGIVLVNRR
jgi:drug/metabolite transporter (DMT)-like permease